jgi:hypothetical protein
MKIKLAMLALAAMSAKATDDWVSFSYEDKGIKYTRSLYIIGAERKGDIIKIWMRSTPCDAVKKKTIPSCLLRDEYDFSKNQLRTVEFIAYDENGEVTENLKDKSAEWDDIAPDSTGELDSLWVFMETLKAGLWKGYKKQ